MSPGRAFAGFASILAVPSERATTAKRDYPRPSPSRTGPPPKGDDHARIRREFETPDPSLRIQAYLWTIGTGVRLILYWEQS